MALMILTLSIFGFGDDLIDFQPSNRYQATQGNEMSAYDWLTNPAYYDLLVRSSIFFSLDGTGTQFANIDNGIIQNGFRGGYAHIMPSFSPLVALSYKTSFDRDSQTNDDNIEYTYTGYDVTTGKYNSIIESANITELSSSPYHRLAVHLGAKLDGALQLALQTWWNMDRSTQITRDYTNTYSNTAAPTDSTLTSKGALTESSMDLVDGDLSGSVLGFEPEVGLLLGILRSKIAVGFGLFNRISDKDLYRQTVTNYVGGIDDTIMDSQTVTTQAGAYYYDPTTSTVLPRFQMNLNAPVVPSYTQLGLDTSSTLDLSNNLRLEIPVGFGFSLYPQQSTTNSTTTIGYNDAVSDTPETNRSTTNVTTDLAVSSDFDANAGVTLRTDLEPTENAAFHLGVGLSFMMNLYQDSRSQTRTTHIQWDNNADGDYADAGTDVDTVYTESGYTIQQSSGKYSVTLTVPLAVSWRPIPKLAFHAGTNTSMDISYTSGNSLTEGDAAYIYEAFTDNLDETNSYTERLKDGSNNMSVPSRMVTTDFGFTSSGTFGFTLDLTPNLSIDALAQASYLAFDAFSLTGVYSF